MRAAPRSPLTTSDLPKIEWANAIAGRIINAVCEGSAALCVMQGGFEIPAAEMKHVQHAEQCRLVEDVAAFFGDGQASVQGQTCRIAFSLHLHRRNSYSRLKMHLLGSSASGIVEREYCPLRPPVTFRKQRHRQENRHGGSGKSDANFAIAVDAEAPFQSRTDIVETVKVRRAFRPGRQGRPFGSVLLQPSSIVSRVARGEISAARRRQR